MSSRLKPKVMHTCSVAEDEIEKLLREIDAAQGSPPPARQESAPPVRRDQDKPSGGRFAFAAVAGVGLGATTFVFAVLTPFTDAFQMGAAGAFAGFLTALIAGPPRWFPS